MHRYTIVLEYFEQGDDLGFFIKKNKGNLILALTEHANVLKDVVGKLESIAKEIGDSGKKVNIEADGHCIDISGDEDFLNELVKKGLVDFEEWDEDDDVWKDIFDSDWDDDLEEELFKD